MGNQKKNREKIEKRNKIIIGIVISLFMITSLASFVLYRPEDSINKVTLTINGTDYEFEMIQEPQNIPYYQVKSGAKKFLVYNLPDTVRQLNYDPEVIPRLANSLYYFISFYPDDPELSNLDYLRYDLRNSLPADKFFLDAIASGNSTLDFPIINCLNATLSVPVVILRSANSTNITLSNNCIDFEFARYDFYRVRDMIVYAFNGVEI